MNPIQPAASVLLTRGPECAEVFVVRRADRLRFFGGFVAFPGGKVHPSDSDIPVVPTEDDRRSDLAVTRWVAAARELFEETGVLLARDEDGEFPSHGPELEALRRRLMQEEASFAAELSRLSLRISRDDLIPIGNLTTPAFVPTRFDTTFFVARMPSRQQPEVWPGELDAGWWTRPDQILERWHQGEFLISPPTVMTLEMLRGKPITQAPADLAPLLKTLADGVIHPIYFAPGVQLIPLRTQALPPSTHTNAFVVGRGPVYLIDPGTPYPEEQERLFQVLDARQAGAERLSAIVLTHHHPDHIGAAALCASRYGLPIYTHPLTVRALKGKVPFAREIHDGDRLDLGTAPGGGAWHLEAIHTPGHAPGHLAFYEPRYRLLFAGDMVSTLSSIVIAPPDGDLGVYLQSLQRLRTLDCRLLLPSHGSASSRPQQTIDECLAHRAKREQELLAALSSSPRTVSDLTKQLYKGLPPQLVRFAELQLQAGLEKLRREGRVIATGQAPEQAWCLPHHSPLGE